MILYFVKVGIVGIILCVLSIAIYRLVKFLFNEIRLFTLLKYYKPIDSYVKMDEICLFTPFIKPFIAFIFFISLFTGSFLVAYSDNKGFMGILSCIIFGTFSTLSFWLSIPKSSFLKINNSGVEIKSLWRTCNIHWDNIDGFETVKSIHYFRWLIKIRNKSVSIKINNKKLSSKDISLIKFETTGVYLLPDNYGIKHEELTQLLNIKRQQFIRNC